VFLDEDEGTMTALTNTTLKALVDQHFSGIRPVWTGERWEVERCPLAIDPRQGITDLTAALVLSVARAPSQTRIVPDQIKAEVRMRAKSGEPPFDIEKSYRAYGVTRELIQQPVFRHAYGFGIVHYSL
jgi:hypothetical protein